jgi:hypothetical protein
VIAAFLLPAIGRRRSEQGHCRIGAPDSGQGKWLRERQFSAKL